MHILCFNNKITDGGDVAGGKSMLKCFNLQECHYCGVSKFQALLFRISLELGQAKPFLWLQRR